MQEAGRICGPPNTKDSLIVYDLYLEIAVYKLIQHTAVAVVYISYHDNSLL